MGFPYIRTKVVNAYLDRKAPTTENLPWIWESHISDSFQRFLSLHSDSETSSQRQIIGNALSRSLNRKLCSVSSSCKGKGRWFIDSGETEGGPGDGSNPLSQSHYARSHWHFHPIRSPVTAGWSLDWCVSGGWITIKHLFPPPHLLPSRQLHRREVSLRGSPRWRWNAETGAVSHPVQGEHLHLRPFWRASSGIQDEQRPTACWRLFSSSPSLLPAC